MRQELPLADRSAAFCAIPWVATEFEPTGEAAVCCKFRAGEAERRLLEATRDQPFEDMWNGELLRGLRRDMAEGRAVPACALCYEEEAAGFPSLRQAANSRWGSYLLSEEGLTLDALCAAAADNGYRVARGPRGVGVHVGNRCNLKCRMCNPYSSSRINLDAVHRRWSAGPAPAGVPDGDPVRGPGGASAPHWGMPVEHLLRGVFRDPSDLWHLNVYGGEPFVSRELGAVLRHLVDAGAAPHVALCLSTNATFAECSWRDLLGHFQAVYLLLSLDGFGKVNDYIRYPSRWETVVANIRRFKALGLATLSANITLQAYNLLGVAELLHFLDAEGLTFYMQLVIGCPHLLPVVVPPKARRVAAERIRRYAADACGAGQRETALGFAHGLEALGEQHDREGLRQFMLFTNDLDATRGQSFRATDPELFALIEDAGFPWTDETLHALIPGVRGQKSEVPNKHGGPLTSDL